MSMTKIETIALGASTPSFTFNNIPQLYKDLYLVISARTTNTQYGYDIRVRPNGSTTNATSKAMRGYVGSAADSYSTSYIFASDDSRGDGATAGTFVSAEVYIPNYAGSTYKTFSSSSASPTNAADGRVDIGAGQWASTDPITSLTIDSFVGPWDFTAGSTATLYGVNKQAPAGSGKTPAVDYLVVAGGGAGSTGSNGGGGGAGGMRTGTAFSVASGSSITVTVGAGGSTGGKGNDSVFSSITSIGGGGGAWDAVKDGGSGGGGAAGSSVVGLGTSGQGNNGGLSSQYGIEYYRDGGGGGAGAIGGDATTGSAAGSGGAGGAGLSSDINGYTQYYAGGGGAGGWSRSGGTVTGSAGGVGGGGNGGSYNAGVAGGAGLVGTGSGGGSGSSAGSGGSGCVIIRYPDIYTDPVTITGSPAVRYWNGYKIYTWTNNGSITF